ncbi:hypothetical protein LTR17_003576 [Elasticomyces elasticus]|nr:hypothetical protein LTR17_003576 [Elasticomyces elasticus]
MEHYESTKKQSISWWRIKQKHRDCQLALELQLQQLLDPLYRDHVVDEAQYDDLLRNPGGAGWQQLAVQEALFQYLLNRHSRYMSIMLEMESVTTKLCKACRVDDPHFQRLLATQQLPLLQARANLAFQAKRLKYIFAEKERAALLEEFEYYVKQLERLLSASKTFSNTKRGQQSATSQFSKKALDFWKHAKKMHTLLQQAWQCQCRSSICFWLPHIQPKATYMRLHMRFCHGAHSMRVELDTSPHASRPGRQQLSPAGTTTMAAAGPSVAILSHKLSNLNLSAQTTTLGRVLSNHVNRAHREATMTVVAQNFGFPVSPIVTVKPNAILDLQQVELCQSFSLKPADDVRLGTLEQDEDVYDVYPTNEALAINPSATLADLLRPGAAVVLSRVQRYNVASTLAVSHLQLHTTHWLDQGWAAELVCVQAASGLSASNRHDEPLNPYLSTSLQPPSNPAFLQQNGFSQLGILLLELCFGKPLEDHKLWQNPAFAVGCNDPIIRHAVACQWLGNDVEHEAGENYAVAVDWTLNHAPKDVNDMGWRLDFTENVVQPLQRCCDSMKRQ